jgi:ATP-dependent Lon protease
MDIPLFPLPNLVLFPDVIIPLHIFEDRYKLMINECIEHDEIFGLVLLRADASEETEETIHRVGVTARVIQVERLEAGRMNILSQGEDRFRIYRFIQQMPYWRASVTLFDEDASYSALDALYNDVFEHYTKACELGAQISNSTEALPAMPESPTDLSYMISYALDIDAEEKQRLLEMTSTAERLRVLVTHLDDTIRKLEQQLAYKKLMVKVRGNGDLGKPGQNG